MSETEQLREDVEETRAELGDTVEALSQKADVKTQVRQRVDERKAALARTAEERPLPAVGMAFGAGLLLGWLIARP
jgi:ElaB/YqjD/DUF883 family membrane-anchored ribosome-binding protein